MVLTMKLKFNQLSAVFFEIQVRNMKPQIAAVNLGWKRVTAIKRS